MSERTDIVLYTQGWKCDQEAKGEAPTVQMRGRFFVNGHEIPGYVATRILASATEFLHLSVRIYASTIRIVPLSDLNDLDSVLPEAELSREG